MLVAPQSQGWARGCATSASLGARKGAFVQHLAVNARRSAKPPPTRYASVSHIKATADVFALDFDGVLVDSEPEISSSAVAAATEYWPDQFKGVDQATINGVRERLRILRPVLIHGVESLVMVLDNLQTCHDLLSVLSHVPRAFPPILPGERRWF